MKKLLTSVFISVVFLSLFLLPQKIWAATLQVPSQYSAIQSAIDAAQDGDIINVAAGTYHEVINFNEKSISIIGENKETTIIDGTGFNQSVVISCWNCLDCDDSQDYPILSRHGPDQLLENFTITGGNTPYTGGGILIQSSSPKLNNLIIRNNFSAVGGGIYIIRSGHTVIENTLIKENEAIVGGGGIFLAAANPTVKDTIFDNNYGSSGAAIVSSGAMGTYINVLIKNHISPYGAPIAYFRYGNIPEANASNAPPIVIKDSKIIGNSASGGSLIQVGAGQFVNINNTQITNNIGIGESVIHFESGSWYKSILNLDHVTIADNQTIDGLHPTTTIYNAGDGRDVDYGSISIKNSILWNNNVDSELQPPDTPFCPEEGIPPVQNVNYSLIGGGYGEGLGILNTNPLFVDSVNGDYRLTLLSPAIDAGDPNSPLDPDGTRADMGAYPFFHLPSPEVLVQNLIDLVENFNLQQGISNSLDAKLDTALNSLSDLNENNNQAAVNSLQAFINAVEAQRENKITSEQADILIQKAQEIISNLSS